MEDPQNLLDRDLSLINPNIEEQKIISTGKFIILSLLSFGLYEVYWIYKAWRFFKQKENSDIQPAIRALFSLFYLNTLFEKIQHYATAKKYEKRFSPGALAFAFIASNFLSYLPDPLWLLSFISVIFLIEPFKALNFAKESSEEVIATYQSSFNNRQIILIVIGSIFWLLVIAGLIMGDLPQ